MKKILLAYCSIVFMFLALPAQADGLRPFVLGSVSTGKLEQVTNHTKSALQKQGFRIVGSYQPFAGAVVICATNNELIAAATKTKNGGFGVVQRIAVTKVKDELQVSYVNPNYLGVAYGLGKLPKTAAMLKAALGHKLEFGSEEGIAHKKLGPGKYHYALFMPYFDDIDLLGKFANYKSAVDTIEKNLAAGKGGTKKVYRVDIPGKQISVFGVAINTGDGIGKGRKDTDKEITDIVDYKKYRHTAYLPYEMMVIGKQAIALRGRYRIALHYPDTKMMGAHGFTKIMSAPKGIKRALQAVAEE